MPARPSTFPETTAQRGRGVAKALLGRALDCCRERGASECYLEVRESNTPAIALYEERGFTRVGLRRGYYEKPREDAAVYFKSVTGENHFDADSFI